jgi:serine/threonine protein phosphatase PrpC
VKTCPRCGASAGDEDVFCEADGTKLGGTPRAAAAEEPEAAAVVRIAGEARCATCGAKNSDGGDGYCAACGHRVYGSRSTLPGAAPAKIGEYTVTRGHGDGDMVVRNAAGASFLLFFGPVEPMRTEESALTAGLVPGVFPRVIASGALPSLGHYVVVDADVEAAPLDRAVLSFPQALGLARALLDAAEALEGLRLAWEPFPSDIHVTPSGELRLMRVRGARPLNEGEGINAKKVLEALGSALVPTPFGLGTPGLVRLLLPRTNFSTAVSETVTSARQEVARATEIAGRAAAGNDGGALAELCDPGLRRNHNEDATAVAEGEVGKEPWKVLVVCDGVSSSTHAEQASTIAAKVSCDALAHFARSGDILREGCSSAVVAAIRAAHVAICTSGIEFGSGPPPGTTIVVALVFRKSLTVGWVGDSRAYWVSEQGSELCTTDHSWVNEAIARGEVTLAEAMMSPLAHALTRCLGPLESDTEAIVTVEPDVRTKALPGPGKLVLCTDGLWNYFPTAPAIAGLVHGAGKDASPAAIARFLVCHALAQGGGDNVSVAVLDVK